MRASMLASIAITGVLLAGCARPMHATGDGAAIPPDGIALLHRMHDRYAGSWFSTLTFTQTTILIGPGGERTTQTWYEAYKTPDLLRIDVGPPSQGNGMLATTDSMLSIQAGIVRQRIPKGNPFLPFIGGIYTKGVDESMADLRKFGFDLSTIHAENWQGQRVSVVGTPTPGDLTRPQFWVDMERLVVVRIVLPPPPSAANAPVQDIRLEGYVPIGKSWLATKVRLLIGSEPRQIEQYTAYRTDVPLDPALFNPATWRTARHWTATP